MWMLAILDFRITLCVPRKYNITMSSWQRTLSINKHKRLPLQVQVQILPILHTVFHKTEFDVAILVGGFNPSEKY